MAGSELQQHTSDDFGKFIRTWLQNPRSVGAVAPSGRLLARLMAKNVGPDARVIELGAGTGTLTQAILDKGVRPESLYVVEQNPEFVQILERRFPNCPVLSADAADLANHVGTAAGSFDFVISGLPLLLFTPEWRERLLEQVFTVLRPGGVLHQFTYGGRCPIDRSTRRRLHLQSRLIGFTPLNLPPAFVYSLARSS